ncbi:DUF4307 domain-containing protein [Cellulomonas sp. NS3]|uniref:DUF4307 domain-containing protein n=1 Tax=Cellulomonas sp. NS3 TaxID=2973977 RepID=UPI002162E82D|nr:DUF4307 domain-containing protein [Cellulomonas sp. NS3]
MTQQDAVAPADRYGRRTSVSRRTWVVVSVAAAVVVVAVLAWIMSGLQRDPVRWQDHGFRVEPDRVVMTFEVTKDPGATVECRLLALNQAAAEVGFRTVTVGPARTSVVRLTETLATAELAVTGTVETCVVVPDA